MAKIRGGVEMIISLANEVSESGNGAQESHSNDRFLVSLCLILCLSAGG